MLTATLLARISWSAVVADPFGELISPLVDPAKLATLGPRAANPRVQKYVAHLADAKRAGEDPALVAKRAIELVGLREKAAEISVERMLQNLAVAEKNGCLEEAGLRDMRRGQAPTIQVGAHKGDELSVDHVIPLKIAPELDKVIANLKLVPLRANASKQAKVGEEGLAFARRLRDAGLLSESGMTAVERAAKPVTKRK
jgi:hypothetical protein